MALNPTPESSTGVFKAVKDALGLFNDTNKTDSVNENSNPEPIGLYESTLDELEIIELVKKWKSDYSVYYADIEKGQKLSFEYWVGKHRSTDSLSPNVKNEHPVTDNLIFQAIETFLPIATRANPEPLVEADPSPVGQEMAKAVKVALAHEADVQKLRRKLAKMTRGWLLNRIGALKVSWNPHTKSIQTDVINTKNMLFDKDGYIDEGGIFRGQFTGEKKRVTAKKLIQMFPKKSDIIKVKANKKMGTILEYIEWWYLGTDIIYTIDDTVLGKFKDPNWNYDGTVTEIDPATGEPVETEVQGTNHLKEQVGPYRFLSIFSTNEQPHDNTSLILQNISQQDKINRREVQIEDNVKGMNNGIVVSGTAFTEDQAAQVASVMRRGVAIRVPNGDVGKAVLFPQKPALPADVFNSLRDARAELQNVFGTSGSTPEGVKGQETVRGKILVSQMDSSRIGGGITDAIEQVADSIYNLWVQFIFVYYDEEHYLTSAGAVSGMELIKLKNDKFPLLQSLTITVKEGSLVPKDPLTQRNEAIDLWSANAIDPLSLFKKLDFPDPDEATNQLILWQMLQKGQIQPQQYLPSFAPAGGQVGEPLPTEQAGTGGPAISEVNGPDVGAQPPAPQTPEAVQSQSQDLLKSIPIGRA